MSVERGHTVYRVAIDGEAASGPYSEPEAMARAKVAFEAGHWNVAVICDCGWTFQVKAIDFMEVAA